MPDAFRDGFTRALFDLWSANEACIGVDTRQLVVDDAYV